MKKINEIMKKRIKYEKKKLTKKKMLEP